MPRNASIARLLASTPPRLGPFRFVAELGEGGFAPVFLASEEYGGAELRTVALKLFAVDAVAGPTGTVGSPISRPRAHRRGGARALSRRASQRRSLLPARRGPHRQGPRPRHGARPRNVARRSPRQGAGHSRRCRSRDRRRDGVGARRRSRRRPRAPRSEARQRDRRRRRLQAHRLRHRHPHTTRRARAPARGALASRAPPPPGPERPPSPPSSSASRAAYGRRRS